MTWISWTAAPSIDLFTFLLFKMCNICCWSSLSCKWINISPKTWYLFKHSALALNALFLWVFWPLLTVYWPFLCLQSHCGPPMFLPDRDSLHVPLHHHVHHHTAGAREAHGVRPQGWSPPTYDTSPVHLAQRSLTVVSAQLYNDSTGKIWRILRLISGGGNVQANFSLHSRESCSLIGCEVNPAAYYNQSEKLNLVILSS